MSAYTNYYTASDTSVFIEHPNSPNVVMIDTLAGVGWVEALTSSPINGLGEQRYGFINSGNVLVNGAIHLNFTHQHYMQCILEEVSLSIIEQGLTTEEIFSNMSLEGLDQEVRKRKLREAKQIASESKKGIQSFPEDFNIRVVFNNGNIYHDDSNKTFLIKGCKIVSSGMSPSIADDGQLIQEYKFIGREVVT